MAKSLLYRIKKHVFTFIGDIKWAGIKHPFWLIFNATNYMLKGKHYRQVEPIIRRGDIVIRRFEGYVDKVFIPGWWNHAGIYIGDNQVVHAISDGVVQEDLIDFMRTDHMIVLRPSLQESYRAVNRAKEIIGSEYDFDFDFGDSLRFSCTELVSHCYEGMIKGKRRFGKETVVADDIVNTDGMKVVWDSRSAT